MRWAARQLQAQVAAELYGLQVLHERIEDQADNTTRFAIVGQSISVENGT